MKCRAAPLTAIRPSSLLASCEANCLPIQYDGEKPPKAWKVAMLMVSDWSSMVGDRKGTSGSWKCRMSKRCSASRARARSLKRQLRVTRPMLPLAGKA